MYKRLLLALLVVGVTTLFSLEYVARFDDSAEGLRVVDSSAYGLVLDYNVPAVHLSDVNGFTVLSIDGFLGNNDVGRPELPFRGNLITVPIGASLKINYLTSKVTEISLKELGFVNPIYPAQPSYSKSQDMSLVTFIHDTTVYTKADYQQNYTPFASNEVGFARGYRVFDVGFSPVQYNPVENSLKIYTQLTVEIAFDNADLYQTAYERERTWSPDFEAVFEGMFLNYEPLPTRDTLMRTPTKYIIICYNATFATAMQPFVDWKRQQGFEVTITYAYTTTTSIKNYLQGLWNAATPTNPAPTYLLIVGDTGQIPANNYEAKPYGNQSDPHITDLTYVRLQGNDFLPEMYFGRFSATSTTEVQTYINKTLMYEKYTMPDPNYLKNSLLIAGVDNSYAQRYCNSLVDYVTTQYIKANSTTHSYNAPYTYLHPSSGNQASTIRNQFSAGVGWANYSAHGDTDMWYDPSFTNTHVNSLTNNGKYPIAIGNACLTNAFDTSTSFSEAMTRTANKGAVVYIGGTNYTYWDEDWWWSAGNKTAPSSGSGATYSATNLGMYDRLFHTHDEATSNWDISVGAMVYAGNAVVQSTSSIFKSYYWEIYGIMGDPSLVPYLGLPSANNAQYPAQIALGQSSISITGASPLARIAISQNGTLAGAVIADASGNATLSFTAFTTPGTADLVITSQNKVPIITTIIIANGSVPFFTISPTSLSFGDILINQTTATQTVTISNVVNGPITVSSISKAGANAGDFDLDVTGLPWEMSSADTQTFTVSFTPSAVGERTASISITSDATGSPHNISLSGVGVSPGLPLPYSQNFNGGTDLTAIGWGGDLNEYSGIKQSKGVNNSNALAMNLWGSSTSQSAYAPRIAAITATTTLSFAYKFTPYSGSSSYTLTTNDKGYIEVSSNGGNTYAVIYEINRNNHTATTDFTTLNLPLSAYNGQNINIQFRGAWGSNDWYFIIDDIVVSSPTPPPTPPPTSLTAQVNAQNVTLTWTAPQNPVSQTGYTLHRGTTLLTTTPTNTLNYTDQNVTPGTYTYSVRAVYSGGTSEPATAQAVVLEPVVLYPPQELTATAGNNSVSLSWQAPEEGDPQGYKVYRNSEAITTSVITELTYTDDTAINGNSYIYKVSAVYADGEAETAPITVTLDNILAPTNLTALVQQYDVILSWDVGSQPTRSLQGYNVYRDTALLTPTPINELTFTDPDLEVGSYSYQVSAVFSNGESDYAEIADVEVYDIQPPTDLMLTTPGVLTIALTWQAPASTNGLLHYNLYRRIDTCEFTIYHEDIPDTTYTDSGLEDQTTYYYRVTAVYPNGESNPTATEAATPTAVFNTVNSLEAVVGYNSVALSWTAPEVDPNSATLIGYRVSRNATILVETQAVDITEYTDDTALNGEAYFYYVTALYTEPVGESTSTELAVQMKVFNAPTELQATAGNLQVVLNWVAPIEHEHSATLLGYKVYRNGELLPDEVITEPSFIDADVVNGVEYSYYVVASYTEPIGDSQASGSVEARPMAIFNPVSTLDAVVGYNSVALSWVAPEVDANSATLSGYTLMRGEELLAPELSPEDLTYTDTTAENGEAYEYSVIALYSEPIGESETVGISVQMKVFNAPLELVANLAGFRQLELHWFAPTEDIYLATLAGYKIFRDNALLPEGIITDPSTLAFTDNSILNGIDYDYYVVACYIDPEGESQPSNIFEWRPPLSDNDETTMPAVTMLAGNYPNPFNPSTTITFEMAQAGRVLIEIYNIKGQRVKTLTNGMYNAGSYRLIWNGEDESGNGVVSGVYFYRMTTEGYAKTLKMLLMK